MGLLHDPTPRLHGYQTQVPVQNNQGYGAQYQRHLTGSHDGVVEEDILRHQTPPHNGERPRSRLVASRQMAVEEVNAQTHSAQSSRSPYWVGDSPLPSHRRDQHDGGDRGSLGQRSDRDDREGSYIRQRQLQRERARRRSPHSTRLSPHDAFREYSQVEGPPTGDSHLRQDLQGARQHGDPWASSHSPPRPPSSHSQQGSRRRLDSTEKIYSLSVLMSADDETERWESVQFTQKCNLEYAG
eukprot:GHVN01068219.1.p1 GENE.GHVN01068219.1~~GHVN01068219.1.p1  ORF type:complete len:241 (-),score=57.02 GHVN01068219.1:765-1487(-)